MITEGVYARYLHGAMGGQRLSDEAMDNFKAGVERLTNDALDALAADGTGA